MRVHLYCEWDAQFWAAEAMADRRPGIAPYGIEHLAASDLELVHWKPSRLLQLPLARRARLALEYGYAHPFVRSLMLLRAKQQPDVALAVLEGQGYLHAWLKHLRVRPWRSIPLVLVSCWLAENARTASPRRLRRMRSIAQSFDLVICWSTNQRVVFCDLLGVPPDRVCFVPFGIEAEFYRPSPTRDGGYVLTVGLDAGRDYETFVEAASGVDAPIKIVCPPERLHGLRISHNIEIVGQVDHVRYRELLWNADVVALASQPECVYPTGQTVLLNAWGTASPTVVTETAALADYTRHGTNTWLVPPRDPEALAHGISVLLGDRDLRIRLGRTAAREVQERFNTRAMWSEVAERVAGLLASSSAD